MLATWAVVPLDPAAAERHFINTYSDGPFAFDEDDNGVPPAQEAPVERPPDRAGETPAATP